MNEVTHVAAASHTLQYLGSAMTVAFCAFFVGWVVWAWWPSNRARLDELARIPLDDDLGGDR